MASLHQPSCQPRIIVNQMNRVFVGVDHRQAIGYNVLQWSIHANAAKPIIVQPLIIDQLPVVRRGLTDFTFTRYLVPYLCGFKGHALFMDADMVINDADLNELFDSHSWDAHVSVVKDQPEFEWPSLMMFNCEACTELTPGYINDKSTNPNDLRTWAKTIGDIPKRWNVMTRASVDDEIPEGAMVLHYTEGLPCFQETQHTNGGRAWHNAKREMNYTVPWAEMMAKSIHGDPVMHRVISRYMEARNG